ncbi:hypothetical protein DXG01_003891 [Tephrocybe rancida]|nr:hypothetical protein DXG01_003891 [Tephrocybe rancida]
MSTSRRSSRLALVTSAPTVDCGATNLKRKRAKVETHISPLQSPCGSSSEKSVTPMENDEAYIQPSKAPNRKRRQRKVAKSSKEEQDLNETKSEDEAPQRPRKKKQPKPDPVYIIPDVESKTTTFKGRLGYACLNTVLRSKKPASDSVFCSRTCRLDSLNKKGMDWVKDLGMKNVEDLLTMIQWNEDNHIRFMRVSSEIFPFASHGKHGYSLDYCAPLLAQVGILANKYGHRLTTHPGQYTQLGSPKPEVIESAVRELSYHCEMLDRMGVGVDGVMIVHGGGMYDDKAATLERIKKTITEVLPLSVRSRLVLENDELCYNAEDLLPLCEELDVPLVFDYHHDALNPSSIPPSVIIQRTNAIFARRGIRPKQHLSEPRPGALTLMEKRAHADRCETLPNDLPDDMASLRSPAENQSKETKGRKSTKRIRAKAEAERVSLDSDESIEGDSTTQGAATITKRIQRVKAEKERTRTEKEKSSESEARAQG